MNRNRQPNMKTRICLVLFVTNLNDILIANVMSKWSVTHLCVSWISETSSDTAFLSKATYYFFVTCKLKGEKKPERKFTTQRIDRQTLRSAFTNHS